MSPSNIFSSVMQCYQNVLNSAPQDLRDIAQRAMRFGITAKGYEFYLDKHALKREHIKDYSAIDDWFNIAAKNTAEYLAMALKGSLEEI